MGLINEEGIRSEKERKSEERINIENIRKRQKERICGEKEIERADRKIVKKEMRALDIDEKRGERITTRTEKKKRRAEKGGKMKKRKQRMR
jgi:hypothetical protein